MLIRLNPKKSLASVSLDGPDLFSEDADELLTDVIWQKVQRLVLGKLRTVRCEIGSWASLASIVFG